MREDLARFLRDELGHGGGSSAESWNTRGVVWLWQGKDAGPAKGSWHFLTISGRVAEAIRTCAAAKAALGVDSHCRNHRRDNMADLAFPIERGRWFLVAAQGRGAQGRTNRSWERGRDTALPRSLIRRQAATLPNFPDWKSA